MSNKKEIKLIPSNNINKEKEKEVKPMELEGLILKKIVFFKEIIQKTLNNEFIKTWNSIAEASKYYGFDRGGISKACSGKFKQSNGYKWEFL